MFKQNKYKVWHDNIIAKGKARIEDGIYEKHHIIPRCLKGSNDKSNLVKLTPREHFIVHMLLCKFTTGYARHKMIFAFQAMANIKSKNRTYKVNGKTSEKLKLEFRKLLTGRKFSKQTLAKMSKVRKGRKLTEEHKKKIGLAGQGRKNSPETISKRVAKLKGKKRTQEFKDRISKLNKGRKRTPKQLIRMREMFKTRKKGLTQLTEEHKRKIGLASIGRQTTLGTKILNKDKINCFVAKSEVDKYLKLGYSLGMYKKNFVFKNINTQEYS
tara:strand:+ start:262 stop:1071 length:810 start_codon:yes stop_codon:yes gene_type:complete